MTVSIEVVGDSRGVTHMLSVLDTALNPVALVAFLEGSVDPHLQRRAADRFAAEGDDVVGAWAPLKPATVAIRGSAHPINVRTGEMIDYITQSDGDALPTPFGATLTSPGGAPPTGDLLDKVRTAQQGDNRTVPRPVLGLNHNDLTYVLITLAAWIERTGRSMGVKVV